MNVAVSGRAMERAAFALEAKPDGPESREVSLSFSSEKPYLRDDGWEILGHKPGEVDLTRLASGDAPLLKDHRPSVDAMVGKVVKAHIMGGRGEAVVRFAKTAEGDKMLARVRAGEVRSVSVGYAIHDRVHAGERDGLPVFRVIRWTPKEISLVAVPADETVGVGRSDTGHAVRQAHAKDAKMSTETTTTTTEVGGSRAAVKAERTRIAEINAIGMRFDIDRAEIDDAIENGTPVDRFRNFVMDHIASDNSEITESRHVHSPSVKRTGERAYSLTRAINAQLTRDWTDAGFEREVSQEVRSQMGRAPEGVYVPTVALAQRDLLTTTNAASLIGTEQAGNAIIDALRPEAQVMALGATVLAGLRQDVSIPRMGTGTTAQWIAEDAEAAESTPGFDSVTLSLRQLSAHTRMSRKQLKQSVPGLDVILQNDLRRQIAVAVDKAAISGAGTAVEPQGILNTPGIGSVAIDTNGGVLFLPEIMALTAEVEQHDVPMTSLGFLSNAKVKAGLLSTHKFPNGGEAILTADSNGFNISGTRAAFSNNVPANLTKGTGTGLSALIYGAWSELLIGQWGGVDLIVDEMTEATKGNVRIVAHSEWDISVRHAEAFAAIEDIVTS
ncbi:MAG: phage major capsid protein [Jhaorihella sp.]